jgi:hypothetical protein
MVSLVHQNHGIKRGEWLRFVDHEHLEFVADVPFDVLSHNQVCDNAYKERIEVARET